jgi:cell wall-associated NlpC family hydrolase
MVPDPRLNAYRPDLAAAHLKGRVEATAFAEGTPRQVRVGTAGLRAEPRPDIGLASQLLFGDVFTVYEEREGWSWGQAKSDSYVGYVSSEALDEAVIEPTHRVTALASHVYPEPDIKLPPRDVLPMSASVLVWLHGENEKFAELAAGGWVARQHISALGEIEPDYLVTAERLIGIPYLWGGKSTVTGIDCSGLVQISLALAGRRVPRDSDMQADSIGEALPEGADLKRGDIVCFPGHIGFMADATTLLHANAYAMCVSKDPLKDVIERVRAEQARRQKPRPPVTCVRRISD